MTLFFIFSVFTERVNGLTVKLPGNIKDKHEQKIKMKKKIQD